MAIYKNSYPFGNIVRDGLVLNLDATNLSSYPGTGTTWYDRSVYNNNGTLTNGPTYLQERGRGSIVFDGVNDYVALGTYTGFGNINKTISVWFKVNSLIGSSQRIITFPADNTITDTPAFTMNISNVGLLQCGIGGNPYDGYNLNIGSYTIGTWTTITTAISGNNITIYYTGSLVGTKTNTGIVATNPIGYLGRYNSYYNQPLSGSISAVQIYNRALSSQEVLQNYNSLKSRFGL
jgi:hypothetical protein